MADVGIHIPTVLEAEQEALKSIDTGAFAARDFLSTSLDALDEKKKAALADKAVVESAQPEVTAHLSTMSSALANLEKQGSNPEVFNNFMALFDSSYSRRKATAQIQQAQGGLTIVGKRLEAQEERSKFATEAANTTLEGARINYAVANDATTKAMQKFGVMLQGSEAQMKESRDKVEKMTDQQLMTAIRDKSADGLMQQEFTRRKMQEAQLEDFTSHADLNKLQRNVAQRKLLLQGFSSTERNHMLDASADTGSFKVVNPADPSKSVTFTRQDILDVQNEYDKAEQANVTSRNEQRARAEGVMSTSAMNAVQRDTMIRMTGSLPAEVSAKVQEYEAQANAATGAGDLNGLKTIVTKQQEYMKDFIDKNIISKAPEPTREALNDFSINGRNRDPQAASKSLAFRLSTGSGEMTTLPVVGNVGASLQLKFGKIKDSQHSFAPVAGKGGVIELPETTVKDGEVLRRALGDSAVYADGRKYADVTDPYTGVSQKYTDKHLFRDSMVQDYFLKTVKSLKDSPNFLDKQGNNILTDETGNLRQEFLKNGGLDLENVIVKLYQYDADQQKVTGVEGVNHARVLNAVLLAEGRMKNGLSGAVNIDQYVQNWMYQSDPRSSELFSTVYGGNENDLITQMKRRLSVLDMPADKISQMLFEREQQNRFVDPTTGIGANIDINRVGNAPGDLLR